MRVGGPRGELCSSHALRDPGKRKLGSKSEHELPKATVMHSLRRSGKIYKAISSLGG